MSTLGTTTGTLASGSDFIGLNNAMKVFYQEPVWDNLVSESEVLDLYTADNDQQVFESLGGRWIELAHDMADGGGSGARKEGGYIPQTTPPSYLNSKIYLKKNYMTTTMSSDAMRKVKQGPYAFITWISEDLKKRVRRHRHHIDRQALGTGTGILCKVVSIAGSVITLGSNFGISGYSKSAFSLQINDLLRGGPNADGSSLRTGQMKITAIDYVNGTITVDAVAASLAAGDFLFLGDTSDNASRKGGSTSGLDDSEMMGLFGIVDSATTNVLTSFQSLTRATTPYWYGFSLDLSAAPYNGNFTEAAIQSGYDQVVEQGGGLPYFWLASRNGRRNYWAQLKTDRQFVNPTGFRGGEGPLSILIDDREVGIKVARKIPDEVSMLIDTTSLKRWQYGAGFEWDDTTGSIWRQVTDSTGVQDAFFAYGRFEAQTGCIAPAHNLIFTGLAKV